MSILKKLKWYELLYTIISLIALITTGFIITDYSKLNSFNDVITSAFIQGIVASINFIAVVLNFKKVSYCFLFYIIFGLFYAYFSFVNGNYGEAIINAFYLLPSYLISFISIFKNKSNKDNSSFVTKNITKKQIILMLSLIVIITIAYGFILKIIKSNFPFINALATGVAICCIYMASNRINQQWYGWSLYSIVLFVLWLLTSLNKVEGIPYLIQNITLTIFNIYVIIAINIKNKKS